MWYQMWQACNFFLYFSIELGEFTPLSQTWVSSAIIPQQSGSELENWNNSCALSLIEEEFVELCYNHVQFAFQATYENTISVIFLVRYEDEGSTLPSRFRPSSGYFLPIHVFLNKKHLHYIQERHTLMLDSNFLAISHCFLRCYLILLHTKHRYIDSHTTKVYRFIFQGSSNIYQVKGN